MAATCPHGLAPSECLICPVLPQPAGPSRSVPARRPRFVLHTAGMVATIVVIGLAAWAIAGVVFAVLHVLELVAVAAVAGWVGYRVGRFRGSRGD